MSSKEKKQLASLIAQMALKEGVAYGWVSGRWGEEVAGTYQLDQLDKEKKEEAHTWSSVRNVIHG